MHVALEIIILLFRVLWTYIEALYCLFVPEPDLNVSGAVIFITGAGRGFGREMALKFGRLGAKLALVDLEEETVIETARLVSEEGGVAYGYQCDVTNIKDVGDVATKVRRDMGDVKILINNAGIMHVKSLLTLSEKDIRRTMEVNLIAHFWTIKEFLPAMLHMKYAHIVTISSMAGKEGSPLLTDYTASKFGARGLAEALGAELAYMKTFHIKQTTVFPMGANTRLVTDTYGHSEYRDKFVPLLTAEEVAEAIVHGVIKGQRYVHIPNHMKYTGFLNAILTAKAKWLMANFMDVGFRERK